MKSPEIKDYWCTDIENIKNWMPDDPENVDLWFSVAIGIEGEKSADNFQVHLVTERQLSQIATKEYLLVVPYYTSWADVMEKLERSIQACRDINWVGMSAQLEEIYLWEYHNYKP